MFAALAVVTTLLVLANGEGDAPKEGVVKIDVPNKHEPPIVDVAYDYDVMPHRAAEVRSNAEDTGFNAALGSEEALAPAEAEEASRLDSRSQAELGSGESLAPAEAEEASRRSARMVEKYRSDGARNKGVVRKDSAEAEIRDAPSPAVGAGAGQPRDLSESDSRRQPSVSSNRPNDSKKPRDSRQPVVNLSLGPGLEVSLPQGSQPGAPSPQHGAFLPQGRSQPEAPSPPGTFKRPESLIRPGSLGRSGSHPAELPKVNVELTSGVRLNAAGNQPEPKGNGGRPNPGARA